MQAVLVAAMGLGVFERVLLVQQPKLFRLKLGPVAHQSYPVMGRPLLPDLRYSLLFTSKLLIQIRALLIHLSMLLRCGDRLKHLALNHAQNVFTFYG